MDGNTRQHIFHRPNCRRLTRATSQLPRIDVQYVNDHSKFYTQSPALGFLLIIGVRYSEEIRG